MSSFEKLSNKMKSISELPDLKKKIIFTLLMFLVARIGIHIPAPGVDVKALSDTVDQNQLLTFFNMFSGGALAKASIFALGVMPYINASIIMQLVGVIIPKFEEIQKEGESGRQKITQWTRYLTIIIAIIQGYGVCVLLESSNLVTNPGPTFIFTTIVFVTAGSVFLMWLGEQISLKGIGNGVSLLIFLNIVSRMPSGFMQLIDKVSKDPSKSKFLVLALLFVIALVIACTWLIVMVQLGERKVPIQYVGRGYAGKSMVAQNTYLPIKVNVAGVMPVIFASVIMQVPSMLLNIESLNFPGKSTLKYYLQPTNPVYLAVFAILIIIFAFFYTAMMFDPEKVADSLRQSGGAIPGIRPGNETVDYIENVVTKITWVGAIFLALVSVIPVIIFDRMGLPIIFQGTGIIIMVGVALDTLRQVDAQLVMKNYEGFIE